MNCTSIAPGTASPCLGNVFSAPRVAGEEYGIQAGYNWQSANWVFGLEADINKLGAQWKQPTIPGDRSGQRRGSGVIPLRLAWHCARSGWRNQRTGSVLRYRRLGLWPGLPRIPSGLLKSRQPSLQVVGKPPWMDHRWRRRICSQPALVGQGGIPLRQPWQFEFWISPECYLVATLALAARPGLHFSVSTII